MNITKQRFLNICHYPSISVLLRYEDPFIEYAIFEYHINPFILLEGNHQYNIQHSIKWILQSRDF